MDNHVVTFVTSYLKIYSSEYDENKTFEKRLALFMQIVQLGIPICLFTSPEYEQVFRLIEANHTNVRIVQIVTIDELLFGQLRSPNMTLPEQRSYIKDLPNYMLLMHAKIEFIHKAIDANPFQHSLFSWFDFSLPYIFRNMERSLLTIQRHASRRYMPPFLVMPGCWPQPFSDMNALQSHICWRFCGGFFIGDKDTLVDFYKVSVAHFAEFIEQSHGHIVWEVNYWAWLESHGHIRPVWYAADHNDSIIDIPASVYVTELMSHPEVKTVMYNYPPLTMADGDRFFASSASYVYDHHTNSHILNTRYVNYLYRDNWECIFFKEPRQIRSYNIHSILNEELQPTRFEVMQPDDDILAPNYDAFSVGLEDIRLFEKDNKVMFIASNVHYVPSCINQMVIGEYDYEQNKCKHMRLVTMPWNPVCEKNWAPLPVPGVCFFVYKWSPYTIGYIIEQVAYEGEKCMFLPVLEQPYQHTLINRFRGSTPFIEYDEEHWVGVVHYSEVGVPPVYYHVLVLIQKATYLPTRMSTPFKLSSQPIEFCIGFTQQNEFFLFWISQMDRDPALLHVPKHLLPIENIVY